MATATGNVRCALKTNRHGQHDLQLWKALVTVPTGATTVSVESPWPLSGVVTEVWIDPGTLAHNATIKGYMQEDELSTPTYFLDYTVPNPAVETRAALNARLRVTGKLQIDVASAVAANSFTVYVWVDTKADTSVTLGAGTAAIGTVQVSDAAHNLVPNSTEADQALTVDATAGGVQLSALHADTTHVFITVHDADIRVTFDSSAPVGGSNGHLLLENSSAIWPAALAAAAKFIRNASTSAVVHVSQLKAA